jgi:hypothetical protein
LILQYVAEFPEDDEQLMYRGLPVFGVLLILGSLFILATVVTMIATRLWKRRAEEVLRNNSTPKIELRERTAEFPEEYFQLIPNNNDGKDRLVIREASDVVITPRRGMYTYLRECIRSIYIIQLYVTYLIYIYSIVLLIYYVHSICLTYYDSKQTFEYSNSMLGSWLNFYVQY